MAFRADESARNKREYAITYLVPKSADSAMQTKCRNLVEDMIDECGPVIDTYPHWHPLVSSYPDDLCPITSPERRSGYDGLDHTVCFVNGFVTCPYADSQKVIDSVNNLPFNEIADISAEPLDVPLYNIGTSPVLVRCQWNKPLLSNGMIPKSLAIPLLLEQEVHCWRTAERAETWETMRSYFLGTPRGSRSSLFVDQETGQAMKQIWNALINTGMYGPIRV